MSTEKTALFNPRKIDTSKEVRILSANYFTVLGVTLHPNDSSPFEMAVRDWLSSPVISIKRSELACQRMASSSSPAEEIVEEREYITEETKKETGLLLTIIELSSDLDEIVEIWRYTIEGSEVEATALQKWQKLSEEVIRDASALDHFAKVWRYAIEGSEVEATALKKWREFSAKEVADASTLDDIDVAYLRAPDGSKEQAKALQKIAEFFPEQSSET